MKKSKIEHLIREYLLDEGILREKIPDPDSKLEFGFIFSYPPRSKGNRMTIFKLKDKDSIILSLQTQMPKKEIKTFDSLKNNDKIQFFAFLRKYFINKEIYFRIDAQNYKYEISEQIFLKKDGIISKNSIFKRIRKLYSCFLFSTIILKEFCSGKEMSSKQFVSDFDFSLYS
ncbi:MAG: DUF2299 family protein [Candidatus Hodarchaeota archaeon]